MNILLPTDFSENAGLACDFAFDLARRSNGSVHVLNAYDLPYSDRSMTTALLEVMKENAEKNMEDFKESLGKYEAPFTTEILLGNPIRLIKEKAKSDTIDLVVMGTKGASGLEEILVGSNAASVINNIQKPALIVPPQAQLKGFQKILFATDFELEKADEPLEELRDFAHTFQSKIDVVHVQTNDGAQGGSRQKVQNAFAQIPHEFTILHEENVEEAITTAAENKEVQLIASIAHRYGFFQGLFHRSITSKLAYHTHLPLLVLHERRS